MINCPVCNTLLESGADNEPVDCTACGYRSEYAGEYLWLYLGGIFFVALGFACGALALLSEGAGVDHWSRVFSAWFPLVPWPESYRWLAFLVVGIVLTVGGLGVTRQRRSACVALLLLLSYELVLALAATVGILESQASRYLHVVFVVAIVGLMLVTGRMGLALRRTPPRDALRLQRLTRSPARNVDANRALEPNVDPS